MTGKLKIEISESIETLSNLLKQEKNPQKKERIQALYWIKSNLVKTIDKSTPEQVKVAYGVTMEKATEIFGITANWIGKSTLETAKYIETVAKSKEVKTALDKTTEISLMAGTMAVDGAILAGEEAVKQISHISNKVSYWWKNC